MTAEVRLSSSSCQKATFRIWELAGQLAVLVNGAFVSSQMLQPDEAIPLLRQAAHALVAAARSIERQP